MSPTTCCHRWSMRQQRCGRRAALWKQAPGNLSYRFQKGDADAVRAAIQAASHVVDLNLVNNRIVICSTETRGAIAEYDASGFHLAFSGAGVHALQSQLADSVFRVPHAQMRVSCPDVGGGFGVKNALYPEWVMLLWAARASGPPGEMDRRTRRGFHHHRARSRQCHARAAGAGLRTDASWRWTSRRSPISAPICHPAARAVPPTRRPTPWAAATTFRRSSWTCAARSPTPCRSTPIAAPASRK